MNTDDPIQPCSDETLADVSGGTSSPDSSAAAHARPKPGPQSPASEIKATAEPPSANAGLKYQHQSL